MTLRFIKERDDDNKYDNIIVNMETVAECLPDILEDFECFLRVCGFVINGSLTIEQEEHSNESE